MTNTRYELDRDDREVLVLRPGTGRRGVIDDMPAADGVDGLRDRFAAGDAKALEEAYDRYGGAVYHLATSAVAGSGRAEEATAMAFAAAWQQRAEIPGIRMSFLAWLLYRTCDAVQTVNRGRGPDGRAMDHLVGSLVMADELAGLPDGQRLALRGLFDGRTDLAAVAAVNGISVQEAEQQVVAVVRRLKKRWERDSAARGR